MARTAVRVLAASALAWTVMVAAWPWAQASPLLRPFQAASEAARFQWRGQVLFDGAQVVSNELPWTYLPTWFALTLPEIWLVAVAAALVVGVLGVRARAVDPVRVLALGLLAGAAIGPVLAAVVLRPVLYDGHRHFLFVLPPAAALAGAGLSEFLGAAQLPRWLRGVVAATAAALAIAVAVEMGRLHPYEYVFFNRLAGGLPGAAGRYETDYWGASYREGVDWLVGNVPGRPDRPLSVAGCSAPFQVGYYLATRREAAGRFTPADRHRSDVLLATTRWNCHRTPGEILHVVEREGVPLLYVILRPPGEEARWPHTP